MIEQRARQLVTSGAIEHNVEIALLKLPQHRCDQHDLWIVGYIGMENVALERGFGGVAIAYVQIRGRAAVANDFVDERALVAARRPLEHHAEAFECGSGGATFLMNPLRRTDDTRGVQSAAQQTGDRPPAAHPA